MNDREFCKCGCGTDISTRRLGTRWADNSHRMRDVRARAASPARKRSGRQVSYAKAVRAVAAYIDQGVFWSQPMAPGHLVAESILSEALPERQRQKETT